MLTPEDLEQRRKHITATDVPAILGLNPWRNAADVYYDKIGEIARTGNDATEAGLLLEPSVLEWAKTQLGTLVGGGFRVHDGGLVAATLDEMTVAGEPVEAKTSGIVGPGTPHQWGADYTDEIPDYYLLQVQAQLLVTGAARAFVPALIGNRGFSMFVVGENKDLQGVILAQAESFWNECVVNRVPPRDVRPHMATLKRMMRQPGKSVEIDDHLAKRYLHLKQEADDLAKLANEAQEDLIAAIGDGEIAKWSGGEFTYKEQTRKGYVVAESTFRVLRNKKAKVTA